MDELVINYESIIKDIEWIKSNGFKLGCKSVYYKRISNSTERGYLIRFECGHINKIQIRVLKRRKSRVCKKCSNIINGKNLKKYSEQNPEIKKNKFNKKESLAKYQEKFKGKVKIVDVKKRKSVTKYRDGWLTYVLKECSCSHKTQVWVRPGYLSHAIKKGRRMTCKMCRTYKRFYGDYSDIKMVTEIIKKELKDG